MEEVVKALQHGDARGVGRRGGREIPNRVQRIGQRVVDHVDFRVVDHLLVGVPNPLHAVLLRESAGALWIAGGDRDQPVTQFVGWIDDRRLGDAGCSEYSDS
jgi:hypothetical protein